MEKRIQCIAVLKEQSGRYGDGGAIEDRFSRQHQQEKPFGHQNVVALCAAREAGRIEAGVWSKAVAREHCTCTAEGERA